MFGLKRSSIQPIGLDLGLDAVRMLQLAVDGTSLSVVASSKQPVPDEVRGDPVLRLAYSVDVVRRMLRNGSFADRRVVVCLPREMLQVKNLRLPLMPASEVESAVNFEARATFAAQNEQVIIQYLPVGEVRHGADSRLEVIALAAAEKSVNLFVEQLHHGGCIVDSIDFKPSALYRGIERFIRRREDENEVNVLLELGVTSSQVIIGKGRDINFFKPVDIGSMHLEESIARKLGIEPSEARALRTRLRESEDTGDTSDPVRNAVQDATRSTIEQLGHEMSLCLRYHSVTFRGQRPNRVRVVGADASDPQLLKLLAGVLPIPVESSRSLVSVNAAAMRPADRRGTGGEWATALGLALKRTTGYFGARDGKKRDTAKPTIPAENQDVPNLAEVEPLRPLTPATRVNPTQEASHARA